jgi:hypothetical protein
MDTPRQRRDGILTNKDIHCSKYTNTSSQQSSRTFTSSASSSVSFLPVSPPPPHHRSPNIPHSSYAIARYSTAENSDNVFRSSAHRPMEPCCSATNERYPWVSAMEYRYTMDTGKSTEAIPRNMRINESHIQDKSVVDFH